MTNKSKTNRRTQKQKVSNGRSYETRALLLSGRGGAGDRIPSGKAYKRTTKHKGRGYED